MLLLNNLKYILIIALLILIQVAVFNNIDFFGFANPYFYIIFILLFPMDKNRYIFLLYAFILGLGIDFLENTGGVNAFATVFVAYIRPYLVRLINAGQTPENEGIKLYNFNFIQWFIYLIFMIFAHHFMVDFMESFKLDMIGNIAFKTLLGSFLSLILVTVYLLIFPPIRSDEF